MLGALGSLTATVSGRVLAPLLLLRRAWTSWSSFRPALATLPLPQILHTTCAFATLASPPPSACSSSLSCRSSGVTAAYPKPPLMPESGARMPRILRRWLGPPSPVDRPPFDSAFEGHNLGALTPSSALELFENLWV